MEHVKELEERIDGHTNGHHAAPLHMPDRDGVWHEADFQI